jgi:hypothetical protein
MRSAVTGLAGSLALLAVLAPGSAHAGATTNADSHAQVYENIQFAVLLDMDFGRIASNGVAGVVELNAGPGTRTCAPGLACVGTYGMSELRLTGSDANIIVTFDPTFNLSGPGQDMVAEPNFPGGSGTIVHLAGGTAVVRFGAKVYVNAGQAPGLYNGQFTVNLEYN